MLDLSTHKAPFDIALPYGLSVTVKPPLTTAGMAAARAAARRAMEAIERRVSAAKRGCRWMDCPTSRPRVSVTASIKRS
jgi:transposase